MGRVNLSMGVSLTETLLGLLQGYTQIYGVPAAAGQLRAIVGALISVQQKAGEIALNAHKAESVIVQTVKAFEAGNMVYSDAPEVEVIRTAYRWHEALEIQVKEILDVYVQQYAPQIDMEQLRWAGLAAIALTQPEFVTCAEAEALISGYVDGFDVVTVLSTSVSPAYGDLARQVAIAVEQRPFAAAVVELIAVYMQRCEPERSWVDRRLLDNAITAIFCNQSELGLDEDLCLVDRQLLAQQVSFQINVMQATPTTSGLTNRLQQQFQIEVERSRQRWRAYGSGLDVTKGRLSQDGLSISSVLGGKIGALPKVAEDIDDQPR